MAADTQEQIVKSLTDVHSTEENAISKLRIGSQSVDDPRCRAGLRNHPGGVLSRLGAPPGGHPNHIERFVVKNST